MNFVSLQTSQIERRSMPAMGYITHTVSAPTLHGKTVRFSSFYPHYLSRYLILLFRWINCALWIILSRNCWQNKKTPTLWLILRGFRQKNSIRLEMRVEEKRIQEDLDSWRTPQKCARFPRSCMETEKKAACEFKNIWSLHTTEPLDLVKQVWWTIMDLLYFPFIQFISDSSADHHHNNS